VDEEQHLLPTGDNMRRGRISHKEIHAPEKFTHKFAMGLLPCPGRLFSAPPFQNYSMLPGPDKVSALVTRISD